MQWTLPTKRTSRSRFLASSVLDGWSACVGLAAEGVVEMGMLAIDAAAARVSHDHGPAEGT